LSPDISPSEYATLTGLVARYSPSGEEAIAVGWLVERMRSLGFDQAFADPAGNAVGLLGQGERQGVLLGHIDTVPGEIPVRVESDLLYGRGAVDAKGPLAAFVDAVAGVGCQPGWQWVVIGAVDEERDSTGARYVAGQYRPDFTIIGEPSRWDRITLGYKGSAWATLRLSQAVSHSAGQEASACEAAIAAWLEIQGWAASFNQDRRRAFEQVAPSLRGMSSGSDGLADWASLQVSARLPLDLPPEVWYARLEALLPEVEVSPGGFAIPAYRGEKNSVLVRHLLSGVRQAGGQPGFVLKTGTADLNLVAPLWSCPAVAYGPGDSSLDHTPHEHLSLQEYRQAVQVLQSTLRGLAA
jgi:LysW-gamma-L-lysine carboxypeptidase